MSDGRTIKELVEEVISQINYDNTYELKGQIKTLVKEIIECQAQIEDWKRQMVEKKATLKALQDPVLVSEISLGLSDDEG